MKWPSIFGLVGVVAVSMMLASAQQDASAGSAKQLGVVKSINGRTLVLTGDSGADYQVDLADSARIVRVAPGQKDLKDATPIQAQDIQPGDRMLVRGTSSVDGKSLTASFAVIMTGSDISRKQQQEREDWINRGIAGLVKMVDPVGGTVTISTGGFNRKDVIIRVSGGAIVRRYSPDSIKFDDAKPARLGDIKPGDQLRARGERDPDGNTFSAQEIVSGTFRNIAGTIISVDPLAGTIQVTDLATKKAVDLRTTSDSQLRALPPTFAQHLAARLKAQSSPSPTPTQASGSPPQGRTADMQQVISRLPAVQINDLHKGDAVMIVATEGSATSPPTAITLLTGVDAILSAGGGGNAAMLLSPWSIGGGDAGATP